MLREFCVLDRPEPDRASDLLDFFRGQLLRAGLEHPARAVHRLGKHIGEADIFARAGFHDLAIFAKNAAERDVCEVRRDAHTACGGEHLLEVQALRSSDDIPDRIRMPAPGTVFQRGQIGRRVEEPSVALADDRRLFSKGGNVGKEDAERALALCGDPGGFQLFTERGQRVVVCTLAEALVEANVEQAVELLKLAPGELDRLLPDREVFRIPGLELDELLAGLALDVVIGFLDAIDLAVEADKLGDGIAVERRLIEEMFPSVDDLSKLGPPVADVVIGDHLMAEKAGDAGQGVAEDRAADVADVHRLGHVRRAEIQDDLSGWHSGSDSETVVKGQRAERRRKKLFFQPEVDKSGAGDFRRGGDPRDIKVSEDLSGHLPGRAFAFLCQHHGGIGLVIPKAGVGRSGDEGRCQIHPGGRERRHQAFGEFFSRGSH